MKNKRLKKTINNSRETKTIPHTQVNFKCGAKNLTGRDAEISQTECSLFWRRVLKEYMIYSLIVWWKTHKCNMKNQRIWHENKTRKTWMNWHRIYIQFCCVLWIFHIICKKFYFCIFTLKYGYCIFITFIAKYLMKKLYILINTYQWIFIAFNNETSVKLNHHLHDY